MKNLNVRRTLITSFVLRLLVCSVILSFNYSYLFAQKVRYVDTRLIIEKMPEYKAANEILENFTSRWDKELNNILDSINDLKNSYEKDEIFLTEQLKKYYRDKILELEEQYKNLEEKYFGYEGELFKKRVELIRPIQNQVYATIKKISDYLKIDIVFDKSESNILIFAKENLDITSLVLKQLKIN